MPIKVPRIFCQCLRNITLILSSIYSEKFRETELVKKCFYPNLSSKIEFFSYFKLHLASLFFKHSMLLHNCYSWLSRKWEKTTHIGNYNSPAFLLLVLLQIASLWKFVICRKGVRIPQTHIVNILSRPRLLFYHYCKYFRSSFSYLKTAT